MLIWVILFILLLVIVGIPAFFSIKYPKQARIIIWFSILGVILIGVLSVIFLKPPYPPRVFFEKMPASNYNNKKIQFVLMDIAKNMRNKNRSINFSISNKDVADKEVTISIKEGETLIKVLDIVTESCGCKYKFFICGTGGGLLNPIKVSMKNDDGSKTGNYYAMIYDTGIHVYEGGELKDIIKEEATPEKKK